MVLVLCYCYVVCKLFLPLQSAPAIVARWVPWAAVAAANCINIPVMRQRELINGITVTDAQGNVVGKSRVSVCVCVCVC